MNEAAREFFLAHRNDDVRRLALASGASPLALQQIAGWQTARKKLPSWAAIDDIEYPQHLSMEQCSSEQTARYKAALAQRLLTSTASQPTTLADLTAGFAVDFAMMARAFNKAVCVEQQAPLCELARHNLPLLGVHAEVVCGEATDYLHTMQAVSMIFLDPARRDSHGGRAYGIADCTPNVLELRDELLAKAEVVMLKLSPMLDWRKAVDELGAEHVSEVHIVSVGGECKELLVVMLREETNPLRLFCVNDNEVWEPHPSPFSFHPSPFTLHPSPFLFEPNASVMKSGCFAELEHAFGVSQLAPNSHLFVSQSPVEHFPGRGFRILAVTSMNKRELRETLRDLRQANITVRNFPMSVAELRRRLKLSEGGSNYLFATTLADGKHVLFLCEHL